MFFISAFALETKVGTQRLDFYLLPILNGVSIIGRILPMAVADILGPLNVFILIAIVTGVLQLCWIAVDSLGGVLTFAVLYGLSSGAFCSLIPVGVMVLTPDIRTIGTRMGMIFGIAAALGTLIGNPIAGVIVKSPAGYTGLQAFAGGSLILSAPLLLTARIASRGWKVRVKV